MIIEKIIDILSTIDKEILIHCAIKKYKNSGPSAREKFIQKSIRKFRMSKPIIDISGIHDPKNGAFIVKAEVEDKPIRHSSLIAAFDLDHTLIEPKSGRKFPKDYDDWVLLDGVKEKLTDLYDQGYKIVIFTNQAGSSFDKAEFARKIRDIATSLDLPLHLFGCTEHGYCRKPSVGMWWLLTRNNGSIEIDMPNSFYVGDAAGRKGDFSDSDLRFATNLGLKFYSDIKMEESKWTLPTHPLETIATEAEAELEPSDDQEMIILVGPPASGKSTFSLKFPNYIVANQDELKTKAKVLSTVKRALDSGQSVIVDRKNEYISDRAEFIKLATDRDIPVRIVWFDMARNLSEHLATYREIMTGKHIPQIVFNKYYSKEKGLQPPTEEEGAEVIKQHFRMYEDDMDMIENITVFTNDLV